jgi:ribosomal protein S6--L-glutamate ligase
MKICVLSRNASLFSTKRLVEEGLKHGHDMSVVDYLDCNIMIEEGNPFIFYQGKHMTIPDAIIPRIGASKTFYGSAIVRQFEMMHIFTSVKSQAIVRSRDKLRSMQILSRHGIGLPKTAFSAHPEQIGGPPIVIKLLEGTQGKGVVLAETINAAKSALDAFFGLKANILIQEYVKESKGRDLRVFVVDGKIAAAMVRQGKHGEFRSNLHQGGFSEKVRLTRKERDTAINAAKALGLSIAGVDILQSNRGPLVMEVNSSPGLEGIETTTGKNVAAQIIRYIERNVSRKVQDKIGA